MKHEAWGTKSSSASRRKDRSNVYEETLVCKAFPLFIEHKKVSWNKVFKKKTSLNNQFYSICE